MADGGDIPSWIESGDWDKVKLNSTVLAGVAEIEDLSSEIEVETKKAKGSEKPRSKDNGNKPGEFRVVLTLTASQWVEFVNSLPEWHPRRLGRERAPVSIVHPLVNAFGIVDVRVIAVRVPRSPNARDGLKVTIVLAEWFEKPVEVKSSNKTTTAPNRDEFLVDPTTRSNGFNKAIMDFPALDPAPTPTKPIDDAAAGKPEQKDGTMTIGEMLFGD